MPTTVTVAGIRQTSPGFKTIRIAPQPGKLKTIVANYPTRHGTISLDLKFEKNGSAQSSIVLPKGMSGVFIWNGNIIDLPP